MTGKAKKNMLGEQYPELLSEWHQEKNDGLSLFDFGPKSHKKIWWKCSDGHVWQAVISSRTSGTGCPYCSGKKATPERNFATSFPELAKQWHPTKNGERKPSDYPPHSGKKVWWVCSMGHEWQTSLLARAKGSGCRYCNRRMIAPERSLGHRNPELIEEWNYAKNGSLTPFDVTFGSDQKVWWICKSGHEWQAIINNRVQKKGCPYCSGRLVTEEKSLAVRFPYLIEEWNTQRNGGLSSFEVSAKSPKRRWWKCSFGHEWESSPYERASMKMCPYCSGQRPSDDNNIGILFPNLKKEWHQTKNGSLTPTQVTSGSGRRVWWICREGHEWQAIIANRVRGTNCPHCHQSKRQLSTRPRSNFLDIIQKQHDQVDLNQFHEQRIRDKEESASDFLYKAALVKSVEVINSLRGRLKEHENRLTHGETIEREFRVTTQDRIKLRKEVSRFKKQLQQRTRERDGVREELEGTKRILRKTSSDLEKVSGLYEESTETIRKKNGKIQELRQHFKSLSKEVRTTAVCESDFQGDQAGYDFSRLARKVTPDLPINPVIPVEESFGEEGIVCLVCGVQLPALVWHLKVSHGMTPDFYRNHFDLPDNFPLQVDVRPDISNKSVEGP